MKSPIMRKLFIGDLLIVLLLLLFQMGFQTFLFEPYLVGEQSKRLTQSMEALQSAIQDGDPELIRRQIEKGMDHGIVLVAADQRQQQVYGQPIYQYQQCFTMEDQNGQTYTIVEDYLDSASLQTMEPGDILSVEGYLVDDVHALVMPSKVYRPQDGVVLGVDTYLIVDPPREASDASPFTASDDARSNTTDAPPDSAIPQETPAPAAQERHTDGKAMTTGVEAAIGGNADAQSPATPSADLPTTTATPSADKSKAMADPPPAADAPATGSKASDAPDHESALPKGFVLHFPDGATDGGEDADQSSFSGDGDDGATLRTARIVIVNGGNRSGNSYPISITGRVMEKSEMNNQDLVTLQGLINEELKRLSGRSALADSTEPYTLSSQMTTGKYYLRVAQMTEPKLTLVGAISLFSIKDMNITMNAFHILLFITELILLTIAIFIFSRIIARPLVKMSDVALKIARQDFSGRVTITTRDEIGTLGQSINTLSTNLEQKMTEINTINERLQCDYERQVESQKRHRALSATFTHELKTPLTIIRGCMDRMQGCNNPAELVKYNAIALRELDRAGNLMTQMLEIAKMESPYFVLDKRAVDLWMVFFKVYDELRQSFQPRGIKVAYAASEEALVDADPELMERVISNVMTNAMRHSPPGSTISVEITGAGNQHTFTVINSDTFIAPEDLEKIWQPFYRSGRPGTDAIKGSGLGLTIVSGILKAHGFQYSLRNTANGVAFSFTFPARKRSADIQADA
ncbi:MAG: HAMP domain-containing histidine kinase [Clostridiales bacterium]|nr:HAMP domain-containing histidine kinase [Clostridiales bacterium]